MILFSELITRFFCSILALFISFIIVQCYVHFEKVALFFYLLKSCCAWTKLRSRKNTKDPSDKFKIEILFQRRRVHSSKYGNKILDQAFVNKIRNLSLKNQKTNYFSKTKVKVIP